jgi:hypothetical protein
MLKNQISIVQYLIINVFVYDVSETNGKNAWFGPHFTEGIKLSFSIRQFEIKKN